MRYLIGCICLALVACGEDDARSPTPLHERWIVHDVLGLGFAVPEGWVDKEATTGLVVSGPETDTSYYTALALQTVQPGPDATFDEILAAAYDNNLMEAVAFAPGQVALAAEGLARWYRVDFVAFDEPRSRVGVLIDDPPYVVDLSYVAPTPLFPDALDVFERALATLYGVP